MCCCGDRQAGRGSTTGCRDNKQGEIQKSRLLGSASSTLSSVMEPNTKSNSWMLWYIADVGRQQIVDDNQAFRLQRQQATDEGTANEPNTADNEDGRVGQPRRGHRLEPLAGRWL